MNITELEEHMSIREGKGFGLPPLQKRIVLYLAKSGAQTINETKSGIKGHYKSSWIAFNALKAKGVIKETEKKNYNMREYPRYWLTQAGVIVALVEGANAQKLLERTAKTYPEDKVLQCILEISPLTGLEGLRIALSAIQDKGKLDNSDMTRILIAGAQRDVSIQRFTEFMKVLKKYPREYERTKEQISRVNAILAKLISHF